MKAILVFDIPTVDSLEGLVADIEIKRWIQWGKDKKVCYIGNHRLKPMPDKISLDDRAEYGYDYVYGWNDCVSEILGEENG